MITCQWCVYSLFSPSGRSFARSPTNKHANSCKCRSRTCLFACYHLFIHWLYRPWLDPALLEAHRCQDGERFGLRSVWRSAGSLMNAQTPTCSVGHQRTLPQHFGLLQRLCGHLRFSTKKKKTVFFPKDKLRMTKPSKSLLNRKKRAPRALGQGGS